MPQSTSPPRLDAAPSEHAASTSSVLSKDPFLHSLQQELASLNQQMESSTSIHAQKRMMVSIRKAIASIDEYIRQKPASPTPSTGTRSPTASPQQSPSAGRLGLSSGTRDAPREKITPPVAASRSSSMRTHSSSPSSQHNQYEDIITRTMEINIDRILGMGSQARETHHHRENYSSDSGAEDSHSRRTAAGAFNPYHQQPQPSPVVPQPHQQHSDLPQQDSRIEYLAAQLNRTERQLQMLEEQLLGGGSAQQHKRMQLYTSTESNARRSQSPHRAHPTHESQSAHSPYKFFKRRITTPTTPFYARSLTPTSTKTRKSGSKKHTPAQQQQADLAHYQQSLKRYMTPERTLSSSYSSAAQFLKAMAESPELKPENTSSPRKRHSLSDGFDSPQRTRSSRKRRSQSPVVGASYFLDKSSLTPESKSGIQGFVSPVGRELDSSFGNRVCLQNSNTVRRIYPREDHSRFLTPESTPGPGAFDAAKSLDFLNKHSFSASFGSKKRKTGPTPDYENPVGPGHYSPNRFWLSSEKNSYRATIGNDRTKIWWQ